MDGTQHDILAGFFGEGCSPGTSLALRDASDRVTLGTTAARPTPEAAGLVGCWPDHVEPTKELNLTGDLLTNGGNEIGELCNITLDGILDSSSEQLYLPDSDLDKLLQPFANSIVDTNSDIDCWDVESLLAASV